MWLSIPLKEMRYIPKPILCELYVVKFWEVMVQVSLSCHAIPIRWACSCFGVPFSPHTLSQKCMLDCSSTKCEVCDMYKCVGSAHG